LSILREDGAVLRIKRTGLPERRIAIDIANVGSTVSEFKAIGEDPKKFAAFVKSHAPSFDKLI